ncbi:uncharacterized protein [Chelonus insularis]|uniref:uncharacterized protein isoform X1 n=1 Tax=Chelonus insularis TaxID=460826 RepID=UPI001589D010|nr:uncharacterized protein LOC118071835 isoform X1 [Chelonus insularis]XP_034947160.1 uncharacterized protein LOC118071835 isoform X1 [Chelonus insularis]
MTMDSVAVTVPLRPPTKKMKKRKELDALASSHVISRRVSGKRSSQELLTDSSDERSEYWNVSVRGNRKGRTRRNRTCPGLLKACSAFFGCASVLATASLIWLFIDVRQQLTALRTEVDQAIAGSEGVPDALQKCHSLSKDLQNNQTVLFTQLSGVKAQISNFTVQLSNIQQGLHKIQELLDGAPELTNVPKNLNALGNSVATFGSKIQDLEITVGNLKETESKVQDIQRNLQQNITNIGHRVEELSKVTEHSAMPTNESKIQAEQLSHTVSQIKTNLSHINETFTRSLQWIQEDQKKDHRMLESLQDMSQNASMKIMSLEAECTKESEHKSILTMIDKINNEINTAKTLDGDLTDKIQQLEQAFNRLKNSTDMMLYSSQNMKNNEQNLVSKTSEQPQITLPVNISQEKVIP